MTNPHITIKLLPEGPIVIKGAISYISGDVAEPRDPSKALVLCRCGLSEDKPLCDGNHKRMEWPGFVRMRHLPPADIE